MRIIRQRPQDRNGKVVARTPHAIEVAKRYQKLIKILRKHVSKYRMYSRAHEGHREVLEERIDRLERRYALSVINARSIVESYEQLLEDTSHGYRQKVPDIPDMADYLMTYRAPEYFWWRDKDEIERELTVTI